MQVYSILHRACDICNTSISSQSGWHCNTCDDFDMCQSCYTSLEIATQSVLHPPHQSDHPMSIFEAPDLNEGTPIQMPYDEEHHDMNWGYVVYDYPNVRWMETFDLVC